MIIKNKIIIFGKEYDLKYLDENNVFKLIELANQKVKISYESKIDQILEIMNNLSKVWANPEYHLRKQAKDLLSNTTSFNIEVINDSLDKISKLCSYEYLINQINFQLGSRETLNLDDYFLNNNNINLLNNYDFKHLPKGIVLHYNYGNLFFEVIESLILGIITKNVNIVKISNKEHLFVFLFLESIKEFDSDGLIWPNQTLLAWDDEKKDIEEIILNNVSTIVFNGLSQKLNNLKNKINIDVKLIDNSYKYSFAVIENKLLKSNDDLNIYKRLAYDICLWNQKISSSPQVIYILDKDLRGVHHFIELLFDEMVQYCENNPNNNLSFSEKVSIRKFREFSKLKQVKSEGRLVCPEDFAFTLFLEYDSKFKISCLNRTVYIKRVSNTESLIEQLKPFESELHTAGIYISKDLRFSLIKELFKLGIKHITDIGNMTNNIFESLSSGVFLLRELTNSVAIGLIKD